MPHIIIRPVQTSDLPILARIDHTYYTDYVWQMDRTVEKGQHSINFREVRMPRSVRVDYPRSIEKLATKKPSGSLMLAAINNEKPVGYLCLKIELIPNSAWITDVVVHENHRKKGIGSSLVFSAQEWAMQKKLRRIILEMQSKNYPAIQLANKMGYELCGYHDHYYSNHDVALFFSGFLR